MFRKAMSQKPFPKICASLSKRWKVLSARPYVALWFYSQRAEVEEEDLEPMY